MAVRKTTRVVSRTVTVRRKVAAAVIVTRVPIRTTRTVVVVSRKR